MPPEAGGPVSKIGTKARSSSWTTRQWKAHSSRTSAPSSSKPPSLSSRPPSTNRHWDRYKKRAVSPYDLCLTFILERVALCLSSQNAHVQVIAESRGRREDNALRLEFARLLQAGAYVSA